jgi:integrase
MATIEARHHGDGSKSYRVKIRLRGVQESETFDRKTDAKEWAARRETEIREGRRFAGTRKTLGEAIDRYLQEELPNLAATVKKGRRLNLEWWRARRGRELLTALERPDILDDLRELRKAGPKGRPVTFATCNRYKAALGAVLSCAVEDWHWLPSHPMRGGGRRKRPKGDRETARERELASEERERLWAACKESKDSRLYPLVVLAYYSGAREAELMGMEWARLQMYPTVRDSATGERRPGVPRAEILDTKTGDSRILYFPGEAADILRALVPRLSGYVFAGRKDSPEDRPTFPRHRWEAARKVAGVSDFRFHDLRHCWAVSFVEEGGTLPQLMIAGGWKSSSQVSRYAKRAMREGSTPAELQDRMGRR